MASTRGYPETLAWCGTAVLPGSRTTAVYDRRVTMRSSIPGVQVAHTVRERRGRHQSVIQASEFRGEALQCLGHQRAAADGELLRNNYAPSYRVKALEGRM
jgi:hypothetical protein